MPWKFWMLTASGAVWLTSPNKRKKSHRLTLIWTLLAYPSRYSGVVDNWIFGCGWFIEFHRDGLRGQRQAGHGPSLRPALHNFYNFLVHPLLYKMRPM